MGKERHNARILHVGDEILIDLRNKVDEVKEFSIFFEGCASPRTPILVIRAHESIKCTQYRREMIGNDGSILKDYKIEKREVSGRERENARNSHTTVPR